MSRLFSQLTLSRAACYKAAARDLKKLLRKAPENCKEHLMNFYCEIVEDLGLTSWFKRIFVGSPSRFTLMWVRCEGQSERHCRHPVLVSTAPRTSNLLISPFSNEDAQSFNTCAQLQDKKAQLEYYECIARPVSAVDGMRKPFSSQCPLSERKGEHWGWEDSDCP